MKEPLVRTRNPIPAPAKNRPMPVSCAPRPLRVRAVTHLMRFLESEGLRHVFGVPGGTVGPLYDALIDFPSISPMISRHEAAAAYAAASYARQSGRLAMVVSCAGPGATNLITGVAAAMRDRTPMLVLTGQVPGRLMGLQAAQEASAWNMDICEAFRPFTKLSVLVSRPEEVTGAIRKALRVARTHPQGPVHVSVPVDTLSAEIADASAEPLACAAASAGVAPSDLFVVIDFLLSRNGVLFVGSGVKRAGMSQSLLRLAELIGWPVVTTPSAKGTIPEDHPLCRGVFGLGGNRSATDVLERASAVLILGSSLGEAGTSNWSPTLLGKRDIVQIDISEAALGRTYSPRLALVCDLAIFFRELLPNLERVSRPPWDNRPRQSDDCPGMIALSLGRFAECIGPEAQTFSDIGEHMTWALRHFPARGMNSFEISLNYGGMGSGIAGAIGAAIAQPGRRVACITGDGCFAMHGSEIHTAVLHGLPMVFLVINNGSYGLVKWGQTLIFGRCQSETFSQSLDVAAAAEAMGAVGVRIERLGEWDRVEKILQENRARPVVIELRVGSEETPPIADRIRLLQGK